MTKKKEVSRDLAIESFRKPQEPYVIADYRLKAQVIDTPTQYRMTKPKMVDPVMNMLCYMMTGKSLEELDNE